MTQKLQLENLVNSFSENISLFIGMASFEKRCLSILQNVESKVDYCLFFKNVSAGNLADKALKEMKALVKNRNTTVELDHDSPVSTADAMVKIIEENKARIYGGKVLIDITTFTHEQLLILLRVLKIVTPDASLILGYNGAEKYSVNDDEHVWLSRGVDQIRTVIGYPGNFVPSKKLHLILLVGFEHERATAVINQLEPIRLSLLRGDKLQSVSTEHFELNQKFFEQLRNFVDITLQTQTAVDSSYVSCIDPFSVRDSILEIVSNSKDYNIVVCPMNTKLSTVGVAMAALENNSIQLAYSKAIEYNEIGYSTPSQIARLFEYKT
ncbi:MAG TPA: hypothetical protein VIO56_03635 [Methylotenera sp.]